MESFSLLRYWRGTASAASATHPTTTIAASLLHPSPDSDSEDDAEGPFFDLEFAVPDAPYVENLKDLNSDSDNDEEEEREFKFNVSPDGHLSDSSLSLSPSDDLFFKGRLVPLDPPTSTIAVAEPDNKFPVSLMRSATKLRVLMLRLRRPKSSTSTTSEAEGIAPAKQQQLLSKFLIKVEEVPIVSLFTRDSSSRTPKAQAEDAAESVAEEKIFSKEVVHKYLSKIKPLYVRVSKRYGEKMRFSGLLNVGDEKVETDGESQIGTVPAGFRAVRKRLGKSRSAPEAAATAAVSPPPPQRRDDSLIQQEDGIQSAIAHCKRSFNGVEDPSRHLESPLVRSMSDPGDGRSGKEDKGGESV